MMPMMMTMTWTICFARPSIGSMLTRYSTRMTTRNVIRTPIKTDILPSRVDQFYPRGITKQLAKQESCLPGDCYHGSAAALRFCLRWAVLALHHFLQQLHLAACVEIVRPVSERTDD